MAQKMTKKERREAAKRARLEAQQRAAKHRTLRRIYSTAAVLVVIALIVFFVVRANQSNQAAVEDLDSLATAASCEPMQDALQDGREHVATQVQYESSPPTSGNHAGQWWPQGGALDAVAPTQIPNERLVHNLEHGAVVLRAKPDVSEDVKAALDAIAQTDPEWVISIEDAAMTPQVAFTSWGKLMTCDGTGPPEDITEAANAFIDLNKRKAPEDIPLNQSGS